uniref:Reverse transcriptase domain-containing protein n=1 Tax=Arundo donax TaxID=35708 RepID=A0A0A9CV51_ARUDO
MIQAIKLEKMLKKKVMGCMIQVNLLTEEEESPVIPIDTEVEEILIQYNDVFQEPQGLPPKRECDHAIHLKSGAEPPNVRPYKVPHYKREAMESLIKQLMENNEIRKSISPYSSPAVLVRKKDGSWRLLWTTES